MPNINGLECLTVLQSSIPTHANSKLPEVATPRPRILYSKSDTDLNAGIGAAEMLGRYNYLALVGGGKNPRWPQTKVWNSKDRDRTMRTSRKLIHTPGHDLGRR